MRKLLSLGLLLSMLLISSKVQSQLGLQPKFNYSELEKKVLYIPTFAASEKFIEKMAKKGKFDKITEAKETAELWNANWKAAMAESSYDMTDYEIKEYNEKELMKSKNEEVLLLRLWYDENGNMFVGILNCGPKRIQIAQSCINGFDLSDKNDVRLMVNMLNDQLQSAAEANKEGNVNFKNMRTQYKKQVVEFSEKMKEMTFLVPKAEDKTPEKAAERDEDVKIALKEWTISKYKLSDEEEVNKMRLEGNPDYYYWKVIPYYVDGIPFVYYLYFVISCESDQIIFNFMGQKKLGDKTIASAQDKYIAKIAKYKSQLEK